MPGPFIRIKNARSDVGLSVIIKKFGPNKIRNLSLSSECIGTSTFVIFIKRRSLDVSNKKVLHFS